MAGIRLFTSNRLEILAEKLSEVLHAPLASPLTPEVIIVQSRGMERWLSLAIAQRQGICANVHFPFPKAFVEEAFVSVLGGEPVTEIFSPEIMTWKLMKLLPSFENHGAFGQINCYLKGQGPPDASLLSEEGPQCIPSPFYSSRDTGNGLKRLQLAQRIARVFDQYLIFRPDMVTAWERGECSQGDERWQCELWRALVGQEDAFHPAARKDAFLRKIFSSKETPGNLPARISLFGISTLPPFYLEIFHALSQRIEVNMFLMNPSREFWGYIRSEREQEREVAKVREDRDDHALSSEKLYLEGGNRLLAALGGLGRDFFSQIWNYSGEEWDFFTDPGDVNLLFTLQSDILNLRDRVGNERQVIVPEDRSVEFHSCHSPMREIEVLYDTLLASFEGYPALLPRDILVMAPDIEAYAPLIKAVFDRAGGAHVDTLPRIPYTIADRESRMESSTIDGFMMLFDMAGGRFGAGQVLAPLEIPEVAAKFGIEQTDREIIRRWVRETGIRWGIDGDGRRRLGLPAVHENTWRAGLDRLLMGYAVPGNKENLIDGILPHDVEGNETAALGKFLAYAETLFHHIESLATAGTLSEWRSTLASMFDGLFLAREDRESGATMVREAILMLKTLEEASGFQEPVDCGVIKSLLGGMFTEKGFGFGFLAGGITFCSLLPMRSIPFRVICLLGMNDADYPRRSWIPEFDLMAKHPRPGDRSRRKDDRYLFLEALLSARHQLIISYAGQNSTDNSSLPPSVLVTELLDYLEEGFTLPDGSGVRNHLHTAHRLQAFSPAYFQGTGGLFSYSEENRQAARCLITKKKATDLPASLLPPPDEAERHVDLADLVTFLADPVLFLLRRRLNVEISGDGFLTEDREPFCLDGLDRYALEQSLVEMGMAGRALQDWREVAQASGKLPHGAVGIYSYRSILKEAREFTETVKRFLSGKEVSRRDVDLTIGKFRLSGKIELYGNGLIHFRYGNLKARDHLRLWITYLALCALDDRATASGILLGKNGVWRYEKPACSLTLLAELLASYWEGLSKPLKFFPRASWEYGTAVFNSGCSRDKGMQRAARIWRGNDFQPGECMNTAYRICFGDRWPLDQEFATTGDTVLREIFLHREKIHDGTF